MNPTVFEIGPLTVHAYAAWLTGGALLALAVITWRAYRYDPMCITRWLDVGIAAVLAGVVGARLMHVALEWEYFTDHTNEITELSLGGLAWHGALLTGLPAALIMTQLRRVPLKPWTDAAALALPVGFVVGWLACRRAGCAYGCEVWTLADWPGWLVEELPDTYNLVVPRLELQAAGTVFSGGLLALALLFTWRGWLTGVRLWLVLALAGLGFALLGFFRCDPAHTLANRRADQVFDLMILLFGTLAGSMIWLLERRTDDQDATQPEQMESEVT